MRRAKGRGGAQWRTRQAGGAARGPVSAPGRLNARAALLARPRPASNLPFRHACANGRCRKWPPGRLLPWFAVSFGAGIVLYFTAEHEPAAWAASGLAAIGLAAVILLRRRPIGFVLALGFLAVTAGFAVATPVLRYPAYGITLAGFVELREESQKSRPLHRARRPHYRKPHCRRAAARVTFRAPR